MTTDLVAFLRARLDEDEVAARAASAEGGTWRTAEPGTAVFAKGSEQPLLVADPEGRMDSDSADRVAAHAARHDPARVLADIEAKRRIVDRYAWLREHGDTGGTAWVLPLLALPYADHPDYREEWRPDSA